MTEAQMVEAMARAISKRGNCTRCAGHVRSCEACLLDARAALDAIREHVTIEKETQGRKWLRLRIWLIERWRLR